MFSASRTAFVTYTACSGNNNYSNNNFNNSGNNNNGSPVILNYYSDLAKILDELTQLYYNFSIGNFDYVVQNFTRTKYYSLSTQLLAIQVDASIFPEYEQTRVCITRSLEGLYQAINLYISCESTHAELERVKARASILDNMTELKKYIQSLAGSMSIFDDVNVTAVAATLKPEIAVYIRLYGYPEGGVFETDKLANAISIAKIQGTV